MTKRRTKASANAVATACVACPAAVSRRRSEAETSKPRYIQMHLDFIQYPIKTAPPEGAGGAKTKH